ncbi:peptidylprolyl isomerase [Georgenia yuyongxinii]|uniref:peptidylprolyl isomerase n=1 Tax=Georgenia yuyongxinii TaxID=2589797 RepID=A0A5B8C9A4_9MICO|nr:FKBP-type peptidyl-prolyl cis-trans isomerase [Georgenia yuyongxinii]QDC24626.1 peptidylprolyl isomerase [Georgenia yuyongxinii]
MRRRPTVLTSLALAAALTLAACSGGESDPEPSGSADETASAEATPAGTEMPQVEGGFGEDPTITFPGSGAPADLQVEVVESGDGDEVGADDYVIAHYKGQVWDVDEPFDSSFERGAPTGFSLNAVVQGWKQGLTGTHEGDRVLLSIPSDLGYGDDGRPPSIPGGSTLVFVVDIVDAIAPDASGQADATPVEPAPDLPVVVEGDLGGPATVRVEEGAPEPTVGSVTVIATGTGEAVPETPGTTLVLQLAENLWDNSQPNSTWETTGVTDGVKIGGGGLFDQLVGVPVGSRVVLQQPGAPGADGAEAAPAIAGVVDIVAVVPAPAGS